MRRSTIALVLAFALVGTTLPLVPRAAAAETLQVLLDRRLAGFPGGAGVVVTDPVTSRVLYAHDPNEYVIAASLYKLGVLLEAERRVDAGTLRYTYALEIEPGDITEDGAFETSGTVFTLDEALEQMITVSDNGPALALVRALGASAINATLERLGIKPFHCAEGPDEDNAVSPGAVARFFEFLAKKQLLSTAASDRMLQRLERQRINDRLPAQLPEGTRVAHKTGNLGFVTHDAGIIFGRNGLPVVVVAMTWEAPEAEAVELIQDIGSLVYANAFAVPANVSYAVPRQSVAADAGRGLLLNIRVTNLGPNPWSLGDEDPLTLTWQLRDARNAVVATNTAPIALGQVKANVTIELPVVFPIPAIPGEYRVTVGLADRAHGSLGPFGVATDSFVIRAHPPFLVALEGSLPAILHRGEASPVVLTLHALAALTAKEPLDLSWRLLDTRNGRVVAQGQGPLGTADPQNPVRVFTYIVAPAVRGTYFLEYFATQRGRVASATARRTVEIVRARSFGDEQPARALPGAVPLPLPTIQPAPRFTLPPLPAAPTRTPAGKTPRP